MTERSRIVLNTAATYGRSLVGLALGLFSTRWVLLGLGQTDWGLYGVVGSLIVFVTFLNTTLSGAVSRFYAYSIGKGKMLGAKAGGEDLCRWFNVVTLIQMIVPLMLVAIGYPIGVYAINNWLVIPSDRLASCLLVFRLSLLSTFVSMASVPYIAMFQAHQLIFELSIVGVVQNMVLFSLAYTVTQVTGDRLIYYAIYITLVTVLFSLAQVLWARHKFKACRLRRSFLFDKERLKEFFVFAGAKIFGAGCVIARTQGGALLLNQFFPPQINAAYSVSIQVSGQTAALSQALIGALQPAVATREGAMDRSGMMRLAESACKFGSILVLLFVVPLVIECKWVLNAWLITPPPYAEMFCSGMLVMLVFDKISVGYMLAANAYGKKMIYYEVVNGILLVASLPMSYFLFRLGFPAYWLVMSLCVTMMLYSIARVNFCRWQLNASIRTWLGSVAIPVLGVSLIAIMVGVAVSKVMPPSLSRVLLVTGVTSGVVLLGGYLLILSEVERILLHRLLLRIAPAHKG